MSFRTLLFLLCISTVVVAQGPSQPSPSFDEPISPAPIPSITGRKPIAPPSKSVLSRPHGLRLAVRVAENDNDSLQRTVLAIDDTAPEDLPGSKTAWDIPRTASLDDKTNMVPWPRPLMGLRDEAMLPPAPLNAVEQLTNTLKQKQQLLQQIEAEVEQLAARIKAAQQSQLLANVTLFKTNGTQLGSLVDLMAHRDSSPGTPTSTVTTVDPTSFVNMLNNLSDAGLLTTLARPKLIASSGALAQIEVGQSSNVFKFGMTATSRHEVFTLNATCSAIVAGKTSECTINGTCRHEQAMAFTLDVDGQTLIGVIELKELKPQRVSMKLNSPPQRLPSPETKGEPSTANVRKVQWLDLDVDRAPVYR